MLAIGVSGVGSEALSRWNDRARMQTRSRASRGTSMRRRITQCVNSSEVSSSVSNSANNSTSSNSARTTDPAQKSKRPLTGREIEAAATRAQIDLHIKYPNGLPVKHKWSGSLLEDAYVRSGEVTSEYAKTFYLGTQLMTPEKARAIWAIYVWCRRTDELVDGPNSARITPAALDRWEERLEALFDGARMIRWTPC